MTIYDELRRRGLTTSLRHFSTNFLGRAPNHACLRRDAGYTLDTLVNLAQALKAAGQDDLVVRVRTAILEDLEG